MTDDNSVTIKHYKNWRGGEGEKDAALNESLRLFYEYQEHPTMETRAAWIAADKKYQQIRDAISESTDEAKLLLTQRISEKIAQSEKPYSQ